MLDAIDYIKFEEKGFVGPFRAYEQDSANHYLKAFEAAIAKKSSQDNGDSGASHEDSEVVLEICLKKEIIEKVSCLLGPRPSSAAALPGRRMSPESRGPTRVPHPESSRKRQGPWRDRSSQNQSGPKSRPGADPTFVTRTWWPG